ncbi:MAG: 2-C-methyl-D-erythritol 4-phosphate cytidylyltransferase [Lachnospiraceae bacterium]|nr:2-C-methyl-D-erythritol 4-phosphate cytidylyltransferase [Lachnospiraceae bacterium]
MAGKKHTAIILAAGKGARMNSDVPKQFLELGGKPVICYALQAFEESFVDEIILVTEAGMEDYCRSEIVEKYGFLKVSQITAGGEERYDSVYRGLCAISDCDYVYIHDGARPFVDKDILLRAKQCVEETDACAAGMPVKDTIKVVDDLNFVAETPERRHVWQMQTPQAFAYAVVREAYDKLFDSYDLTGITDDAMVVERSLSHPVKLFEGSYRNMKITTPEDLALAERMLDL